MLDKTKPDELDRQLDEALACYTEAPARLGLEDRIQARVTTSERRIWPAAVALGIAALVALVVLLPLHRQAPDVDRALIVRHIARHVDQYQGVPPNDPVSEARVAVPARRAVRVRHRVPKRAQFPTPLPLSAAEREWIEIGRSRPDVVAFVSRPMRPIEVPPIQIRPLIEGEK